MTHERIVAASKAQPFQPFIIHMAESNESLRKG
jgi:hypothetical protein